MHRPSLALIAALPCLAFAVVPARAATRTLTALGSGLAIDSPCARHVTITPDAASGTGITVNATADNQEELDRLRLSGGASPKLTVPDSFPNRCWRPSFSLMFKPTLVLAVHVSAGTPLNIDDSGEAIYVVGDTNAPLALDLSGAAKVKASSVASFNLDISGSADVSVANINGPIQAELSGNGGLDIGQAAASAVSLELSGRGSVSIKGGTIGKLSLNGSGVAEVSIGATVGDATIDISGVGSVKIAKVTGALEKDVSGMATVDVGRN